MPYLNPLTSNTALDFRVSAHNNQGQYASGASYESAAVEGAAIEAVPAISVVIPLYNKREHILDTLASVFSQTFKPLEVIVVDDGSTDDGAELVEMKYGTDVSIVRQQNDGVSKARNRGIAEAKGDYIAFLDADDFWASHYLEEITALIRLFPKAGTLATSYQYCEGNSRFINPKIRFTSKVFQPCLMPSYFACAAAGDLPFNASSVVMKQSLLNDLHGFPESENMGEDQDLWARAALRGSIAYSPKVLSFYNRAADNRACEAMPPQKECAFSRRLYTYALNARIDADVRESIIDYTTAHLIQLAERNVRAGNTDAAEKLLADKRCRRKPAKRLRAYLRLRTEKVWHHFDELCQSVRMTQAGLVNQLWRSNSHA